LNRRVGELMPGDAATKWVDINGAALRYQITGEGSETLVLIHEMGGTLESWDLLLPTLARARRVLRYDTRGAGLSEKLRGTADIDVMAADLAALLDRLGIAGPVALAGCAVGAAIAIHFAARFPSRTAALIAMAPATGIAPERRTATLALAERLEREGVRASLDEGLLGSYPLELRGDAARFQGFRAARLGNDPASYAAIYRMLVGLQMAEDFARIRCPTLVIAGRLDRGRPPAVVEPVARAIAGARFQVLETSHFMAVQTPELVSAAMLAFLDEVRP
jgi:3-oxoadipate enol-lactonase